MKRLLTALCLVLGWSQVAIAASCSSYPFTLQNNTTADATQVMANFNAVRNCVINNTAGSGVNTDITSLTGLSTPLSVAQGGTPVFIGGTSTGSANAQVVASTNPIGYSLTSGYRVTFTAGATNTGAATLNVNSTGATAVRRVGASGLEALTGAEIVSGNIVEAIYNGTFFVLLSSSIPNFNTATGLATGATVDLGVVPSHNVNITSSGGTITSFGSTAVTTAPIYLVKFVGANTLTYNATSLIIPGTANITTAANDTAVVEYLGSGNWQVLQYQRATGTSIVPATPLCGAIGFTAGNNSGTPNTNIDVAASQVVMLTTGGASVSANSASVTINTTTTGANALDTGARAVSTWYNLYLISNGSTTAGLASASATAPTMPSGYTYKCRLGAMRTDGAGNFFRTNAQGPWTYYTVTAATNTLSCSLIKNGIDGTWAVDTPVYAAQSISTAVPPTATHINVTAMTRYSTGAESDVLVAPTNQYGGVQSVNPPPIGMGGGIGQATMSAIMQIRSSNIYYVGDTGGGAVFGCGWKDAVNAS